jgi:hypothetical protein
LAALLATIQPGTGKDQDCQGLLRSVRREADKLPRVPNPVPATEPSAGPPASSPPLRSATSTAR